MSRAPSPCAWAASYICRTMAATGMGISRLAAMASASDRSLRDRLMPKDGAKFPASTVGMRLRKWWERPPLVERISKRRSGSTPAFTPSTIASAATAMFPIDITLLTIFTTWPEPRGPTWWRSVPSVIKRGRHRSSTVASPPMRKTSLPLPASTGPPLTGASRHSTPDFLAGAAGFERAVLAEIGATDGRGIGQARQDEVRGFRDSSRRRGQAHSVRLGLCGADRVHVIARHGIALGHEAPRHLPAHGPQAEKSDPGLRRHVAHLLMITRSMELALPLRRRGRQGLEELEEDAVEGRGLIEVRGVPGARNDLEPGPGNLLRHVLAGGEKRLVLVAHDDQGGHRDRRDPVDDARVALREHPTRGVGQPLRGAMQAGGLAHLAAPSAECVEPARFQLRRPLVGPLVPGPARLGVPIPGAGVADDERADHLRMREGEAERGVAAEGEAAHDRFLHAHVPEQRPHVAHRQLLGILGGIVGALRLSVPAHAPADDGVAALEGAVLAVPHAPRGRVAVAQEHGGAAPAHLVVDLDSIEPRASHVDAPFAREFAQVCHESPRRR